MEAIEYIASKISAPDSLEFTQPKVNDYDEAATARMLYIPIEKNVNVTSIRLKFDGANGFNPLEVFKNANFGESIGNALVAVQQGGLASESFDKFVLRDVVQVNLEDFDLFVSDIDVSLSSPMPEPEVPRKKVKIDYSAYRVGKRVKASGASLAANTTA